MLRNSLTKHSEISAHTESHLGIALQAGTQGPKFSSLFDSDVNIWFSKPVSERGSATFQTTRGGKKLLDVTWEAESVSLLQFSHAAIPPHNGVWEMTCVLEEGKVGLEVSCKDKCEVNVPLFSESSTQPSLPLPLDILLFSLYNACGSWFCNNTQGKCPCSL